MVIDVALCHDCNNCFIACKDEHVGNRWLPYTDEQPRHSHRWMNILHTERGQYPRIDVGYLPLPCQHCQDAPCAKAHPECVSRREDGVVMIDMEKAKGNEALVEACPYGAIYWNAERGVPQKCTMCAHLLDGGGELGMPRCAHSCPTGAIEFYTLEPEEMAVRIKEEGLEVYRPELETRPHVFYKNLFRFNKAFVAGGVLKNDDCAEGVEVTLKGKGCECSLLTDCFGDFKFDALDPGEYAVIIDGKEIAKVDVRASLNLGTIVL
jgi:Fe-S-cluster-containing dehydrogenase component